jgi:hypothetical protein
MSAQTTYIFAVNILTAVLFACASCAAGSEHNDKTTYSIEEMAERIKATSSTSVRRTYARQLSRLVCYLDRRLTTNEFDDITGLLSDKDSHVTMFAAAALGTMGAKATPAIPALQDALKRAESEVSVTPRTGIWPDRLIRGALQEIKGERQVPPVCKKKP